MTLRTKFSLRFLLLLVTVAGVCLGLLGKSIHHAQLEHEAIKQLVALGASYDDWIGWREMLNSDYRPIESVDLPDDVKLDVAMDHLLHLENLAYLALGEATNDDDLQRVAEIYWIRSLDVSRANIGDESVNHLQRCKHLKWLYLSEQQLSKSAQGYLQRQLPDCSIEVR